MVMLEGSRQAIHEERDRKLAQASLPKNASKICVRFSVPLNKPVSRFRLTSTASGTLGAVSDSERLAR